MASSIVRVTETLPASPRRAFARRFLRYLGAAAVVVLVALAGTAGWLYIQMRGSLAQLDTLGCEDLTRARAACQALMLPMQHAPGREDYLRDLGLAWTSDAWSIRGFFRG